MKNLKQKTIKSLSWNGLATVVVQLSRLIVGIVLARLLDPSAFGLIAMIILITGFADLLKDLGFSAALIQKQNILESHLSSVFWANVIIGVCLTILFYILAPYIANFYNSAEITLLMRIMSITFLISSVGMVHLSLLKKGLDFGKISIINIISNLVIGGITIALAYKGFEIWSLVLRAILLSLVNTIGYWILSNWSPRFIFDFTILKELFGFSFNYTGIQSFHYWTKKIDDLFVGKFLGVEALGIYSKAYQFLLFPVQNVKNQIANVTFPALSTIQNDPKRVKKAVIKMIGVIAIIVIPMMTTIFLISEDFVLGLLGQKWKDMIPILQIFCLGAIAQSLSVAASIYFPLGRSDLALKYNIFAKIQIIALISIGVLFDVFGVAIGVTLGLVFNFFYLNHYAGKLIELKIREILGIIAPHLLISLCVVLTYYFVAKIIFVDEMYILSYVTTLILKIVFILFMYVILYILFKPNPFREILEQLETYLYRFFKLKSV